MGTTSIHELVLEQVGPVARFLDLPHGHAALFTAQCPGSERTNQDAAAIIQIEDWATVLAVADGFGGCRGGEQASRIAVETLKKRLAQVTKENNGLRAAILDAFEEANRKVLELGIGAASTFAVLEIKEGSLRAYHVGDSQILVVGQRGKIKHQTTPHSPVGYAIESGVIDETEAMYHEERHLVSNMIGSNEMHIQIGPSVELAKRDTVIIASDGLFDNLHTGEVIELARAGLLPAVTESLAAHTNDRMASGTNGHPSKPDDLTFILFRPNQA